MEGETAKGGGGNKEGAGKGRKKTPFSLGSAKIDIDGVEAAPVDYFVGNTNPTIDENKVKEIILKCASLEIEGKPDNLLNSDEVLVKCMNNFNPISNGGGQICHPLW